MSNHNWKARVASCETADIPQFVKGRKGNISLVDCLVRSLWQTDNGCWPARTFAQLRADVSELQGYNVALSTIRSSIYQYPQIFERVRDNKSLRWRLTDSARARRL